MHLPVVIANLLLLASAVFAISSPSQHSLRAQGKDSCRYPRVRKEWRKLSLLERVGYINAIKCLHSKPSVYSDTVPSVLTAYEDFIYVHKQQTPYIHLVGHFLPWHRFLGWQFESALRSQCGYTGAQPYWDWTLDVANNGVLDSPVFSPITGFGGNGLPEADLSFLPFLPAGTGGGCVTTGPFARDKFVIHLGSNVSVARDDRCIKRDVSAAIGAEWNSKARVADVLGEPDFGAFFNRLDGNFSWADWGIHSGGHYMVGGTLADVWASNADPLFYLHHATLDKLWWEWQSADPVKRLKDISCPIKPWNPSLGGDLSNISPGNVTLGSEIDLGILHRNITVGEVMDTTGDLLCYTYE